MFNTNFGTIFWELTDVLKARLNSDRQGRKVLIFGNGRSGSTVLQQMLSTDDTCIDLGELLRRRRKRFKACPQLKISKSLCSDFKFVNGLANYHLKKNGIKQVCAHIKPMQVGMNQITDFLSKARSQGWTIILLYRSVSEVVVSAEKAGNTKLWHTPIDQQDKTALSKDLEFIKVKSRLLGGMQKRWLYNQCMKEWGKNEAHVLCDFHKNLSSDERKKEFTQLLTTTYPKISIGLNNIKIKRSKPLHYRQTDLEVIEFLRKEEAILDNSSI